MDIIKKTGLWFTISGALILLAVFALSFNAFVHGRAMNFGIDFTGGTLLNLRFEKPVEVGQIRPVLDSYKLGESISFKSRETGTCSFAPLRWRAMSARIFSRT